jgi:hypothetical protein
MAAARCFAVLGSSLVAGVLVSACGSNPPTPDWQLVAKGSLDRATAAWFDSDAQGEAAAFEEARQAIARTGQPGLLARAELVRCAAHVAALVVEECTGYTALAADAGAEERAYAAYLAGRASAADAPLLPEPHRALAASGSAGAASTDVPASADPAALTRIQDPLSRLVAAAVLMQTGRASPAIVGVAVDTASAQGWRRPLRSWLQVQMRQAEAAGDSGAAERVRRRIALVERPAVRPGDPAASSASARP